MPLIIPWKYIEKHIYLPNISPTEIVGKLNYYGLENKLISYRKSIYFQFDPTPNRLDLFSWWGMVCEIGVLLNCKIKLTDLLVINEEKRKLINVEIKTSDCLEFCLVLVKNIEVKESPPWVKEWLEINNIRSVNNIVDATNLIMLETGQPLHAFDYDKLSRKEKITISQAKEGKKIITLAEQELTLNSEDITVSSEEQIISLAGIVGTKEASLTIQSKNILIECASFNSEVIRKTTKRLNISTVASHFFCRGINSTLSPKQVFQRVIFLTAEIWRKELETRVIFTSQEREKKQPIIAISQVFIEKKIGQEFPELTIEKIWQQLKFSYQKKEDIYYVTIPSHRPDISIPEDLLEELLRIYDYNKVISSLP